MAVPTPAWRCPLTSVQSRPYGHWSLSTNSAGYAGAAAHVAGGCSRVGARCLRCHALLVGAGAADAGFWDVEDRRRIFGNIDAVGVRDWRGRGLVFCGPDPAA